MNKGLPCPECARLPGCETARQIYVFVMTCKEAGVPVTGISLTCPHVPRGPVTTPGEPVLARSSGAAPCNTVKDKDLLGTANVTALPRTGNANTKKQQAIDTAIEEMSRDGLSSRQIAEQLGMAGIDVSHMTVSRHLRKARVTA
jgi:hypothetical protein